MPEPPQLTEALDLQFQLRDAIFSYYRVFDVNIKVWSFYWLVAIGILGFLWATKREPKLKWVLVGVFGVFAIANLVVVALTQNVLRSINADVVAFIASNEVAGGAFDGSLKQMVGAVSTPVIVAIHLVADACIFAALCFAKTETAGDAEPAGS